MNWELLNYKTVLETQINNITERMAKDSNTKVKLSNFIEILSQKLRENLEWLTYLFFPEIVLEFKTGEKDGLIKLKIGGNENN